MAYLNVTKIALDGANQRPQQLYVNLSSKMCWDAVKYCGYLANMTSNYSCGKSIITSSASVVTDSTRIPEGDIIGFFENGDLKHAMISTGMGRAAGNKNDCMGIGHAVGWEELALPQVSSNGEFTPQGQRRVIVMRHTSFV